MSVHFTGVDKITPSGVVGSDGIERQVDTIVCATGFDVSYRPRFPIIGRNNVSLADKWGVCPEGYLGLGIPDFPNFLTFIGPNWPVENGSVMGPLMYVSYYALQMIRKLQTEYVHSAAPKQDVTDDFNSHCQEWVRHTVWTEDCRSWYKNNETGRVNAVWPGSSLHYIEAIKNVRWEDYELKYTAEGRKNRFAYLGMGTTEALVKKEDPSPYLSVEGIDPEWMRAVGIDEGKVKGRKLEDVGKEGEKGRENMEKANIA